MLKKIIKISIVFILSFSFKLSVFADPAAEDTSGSEESMMSGISNFITEIFDSVQQYIDLIVKKEENTKDVKQATSDSYWWPIGSKETTIVDGKEYAKGEPETITESSPFGYRNDPFGGGNIVYHSGLDIKGGRGAGQVPIIASKSGVVVKVVTSCYSFDSYSCGGTYGNHVIIQHSDGNYTLYAHLHQDTITVSVNDPVTQGQVIAKMGSSGASTGAHLHFEVRQGQNAYSAVVDPKLFISSENPRGIVASVSDDEFISWLTSWEGHTPINGENYVVTNIGDGVRTVGAGVTLENNPDSFATYGIDISEYPVGSEIPISIVNQIKLELVDQKRSNVEKVLSNNSIVLEENQIQALISQVYNIGHINGFASAYKQHGNTQAFYDNWFFRAVSKGTKFEKGLTRRRNAEWALFNRGKYVYNS